MPRERFLHFVVLFLGKHYDSLSGHATVVEALRFTEAELSAEFHDADGAFMAPVTWRPADAAWEFVQYRMHGAKRPYWMPAR